MQPGPKPSIQGAELLLGVPWRLEGEALGGAWGKTPKKHIADGLQPAEERVKKAAHMQLVRLC